MNKKEHSRKDRRKFLSVSGYLLGSLALNHPLHALTRSLDPEFFEGNVMSLIQALPHRKSAVRIGKEYLKLYPQEAHPKKLFHHFKTWQQRKPAPAKENARFLDAQIKQDFRRENTVEVKGWVLSRTEARLCALAFFSNLKDLKNIDWNFA